MAAGCGKKQCNSFMSDYILVLLIHLSFLLLLATSFNLTAGYLGYINLATAALYGLGAHITGILTTQAGWNFFATMPLSALGGLLLGSVIGLPAIRVRGIYYLIISIGFQLVCQDILKNSSITGDKAGIRDIPFPSLFGYSFSSPLSYWLLSLFTLISVLV